MLTRTSRTSLKIINQISFICQNTGIHNKYYCSLTKMSEPKWKSVKTRLLNMTLENRRKQYEKQEYLTVNMIPAWDNYIVRHAKEIESKRYTLDDLAEFKKIKINNALNKSLAQKVSLYRGDITKLEVSAVVNAANSLLQAGGGVDGAIHRAAGPYLQDECNTLNGCPTGHAKITCGYNLPAKYVIHTVGPQDGSPEKLQECYENCLNLCKHYKLISIAIPCISTGIYGFPNRLAAHIALRTSRMFLEKHEEFERIIFCTFIGIDVELYETLMQMYFPVHDWNYADGASTTE